MKHRYSAALAAVAAATLVLAGCSSSSDPDDGATGDAGAEAPTELTLGLVPSQDVDELPLEAEQLAELLGEELGVPVEGVVSSDYTALVTAMQTGQADVGMFGPIGLVQAEDQAGAVPVLQSIRYGSSTYVTQWYTKDTDRFCLDEVVTDDEGYKFCNGVDAATEGPVGEEALEAITQDEAIAFVDPGSASGYYYPSTQLEEVAGLDPLGFSNAVFAGGHPNAILAVLDDSATVGVSFNDARSEVVEERPEVKDDVVVFAWSTNIPNDGVAVSSDLSEEWQQKIADAFLAVAETDEGVELLQAVYNIDGFAPADLDAIDQARQVAENFG